MESLIDKLEISPELREVQAMMPISDNDYDQLKKDIRESGKIRDPLKVYLDRLDGKHYVIGGANRLKIAKELKFNKVPIEVIYTKEPKGKKRDELSKTIKELAINDNLSRRHLTTEQKRNLISFFLKSDPGQSNKSIAQKTGTTKETVKSTRKKMESGGEIRPVNVVKGKDGKIYKKPNLQTKKPPQKNTDKKISKKFISIVEETLQGKDDSDRNIWINSMIEYLKSLK